MTFEEILFAPRQTCTKCCIGYVKFDETGWGMKFNQAGVCECCSARQQKALESLQKFSTEQKVLREQRKMEDVAAGVKTRKTRKDKGEKRGKSEKRRAAWLALTPEARQAKIEIMQAGRKKAKQEVPHETET